MPDGLVSVLYHGLSHVYLETPITYAFVIRVYILGVLLLSSLYHITKTVAQSCHRLRNLAMSSSTGGCYKT